MALVLEFLFSVFGELILEVLLTGALELFSGAPAPARLAPIPAPSAAATITGPAEAAIVLALARQEGAAAERRILGFLENGSPETQLAAVQALRHVGTLASIEPLRAKAQAWFAGDLGRKAARAIEFIRHRHARAAPGALSMSPSGLRGELSLAAPRGALAYRKTDR